MNDSNPIMNDTYQMYPRLFRLIHMGLAIFGIAAYLTAEAAEDGNASLGYLLHAYLGMTLSVFIILRLFEGYLGAAEARFSRWALFSKQQLHTAIEDLKGLARFKMPERDLHEGIAGMVQAFGLIVFAWMSVTGSVMFFIDEHSSEVLFEIFEELHEVGEGLIPMFLLLHIGAVIVHSLNGVAFLKRMWRV
jgi:cytochrome b